ncbi:MAG: hypothetical protein WA728_23845, partial [Xanthobacteraceae bacterium]
MRRQWEPERGNFTLRRQRRAWASAADNATALRLALLRRTDANRDERCIRGTSLRTAGRGPFSQELRGITGWPAISGDEDFIVLTLH